MGEVGGRNHAPHEGAPPNIKFLDNFIFSNGWVVRKGYCAPSPTALVKLTLVITMFSSLPHRKFGGKVEWSGWELRTPSRENTEGGVYQISNFTSIIKKEGSIVFQSLILNDPSCNFPFQSFTKILKTLLKVPSDLIVFHIEIGSHVPRSSHV